MDKGFISYISAFPMCVPIHAASISYASYYASYYYIVYEDTVAWFPSLKLHVLVPALEYIYNTELIVHS